MSVVLKLAAAVSIAAGVVVERGGYVRTPGFALVSGTLVALYLWFLAKTRPYLRPKS